MKKNREEILTFIVEIKAELTNISILLDEIKVAGKKLKEKSEDEKRYIIESLALKLHNFYITYENVT